MNTQIFARHEKIIGYILLALGVVLIVFAIVQMFAVYGGGSSPPNLVTLSDLSLSSDQAGASVTLLKGEQLSQLPNLFFWFMLMSFLMFAGGKIASLGVTMIKDVKVEISERMSMSSSSQETQNS
jgi:hypothetical protein